MGSLFGYNYCLCGALNLAGSAYDARVIVYDHRFLSFVTFSFLKLEHRNRAYVHTDRVPVALVQINHNTDHDLTPLEVQGIRSHEVIS